MSKQPFEKVRSLVERRNLFESVLREKSEIICRGADESLFQLTPMSLIGDSLMQGFMTALDHLPTQDCEMIGNFSVGFEKYFFSTLLKVMGDEAVFHLNCDVYQLQRRSAFRLRPSNGLGVYVAITEVQGRPIYSIAHVVDISSGGARLFFSDLDSPIAAGTHSSPPQFRVADQLKCVLHLGGQKTLELKSQVRHIQKAVHMGQIVEHIGVEFIDLTPILKNRLLAMTMDLQKKMVLAG